MANTKHQCCEAFVNRASRIPAPIHRFKEAEKRAKTLKNTNTGVQLPHQLDTCVSWTYDTPSSFIVGLLKS